MNGCEKVRIKRVVHVITGLTTGGAEMMLLRLLKANQGDWDPVVVSLMDEGTIGSSITGLGVPVHCLGMRPGYPNPLRALPLVPIMRRLQPSFIVGWMYHGNLMASLAQMFSSGRRPVFWNIQQALDNIKGWGRLTNVMIRLGARLSGHPAAIIYNTQVGARQHEAIGYSAEKSVVIPAGFDCTLFHPDDDARRQVRAELGVSEDAILVGLVARYHPMKDHAGFVRAAAAVAQRHAGVRFVLIGKDLEDTQSPLMSRIREERLLDRFSILGERTDMPRLTAALDIACSSSAWGEGFSNAVGEAMASGVPCVVTDVGDSAYAIGNTGLCVPPRDPAALGNAISSLVEAGPDYRRRLAAAARLRVESEFSLPQIARRYEELYQRHLAG